MPAKVDRAVNVAPEAQHRTLLHRPAAPNHASARNAATPAASEPMASLVAATPASEPDDTDTGLREHTPRLGLWLDSSDQTPEQTVDEIVDRGLSEGRVR